MVVRKNPMKEDGKLRHLLTSQQDVGLRVTTLIQLSIESIECQDCIDSDMCLIIEGKCFLKKIFIEVEICRKLI